MNSKGSFSSNDNRSKGILDIIHSHVCRQITIPSLGNFMYCVIFIDYYYRKTWIYFLKGKYEVLNKFQEFKDLVENLYGRKIQILSSNEFKYFCSEEAIKRELKIPTTPRRMGFHRERIDILWKHLNRLSMTII
jgi:hypothetical protein